MNRYYFVNYKNKKILYVDFSKLSGKELMDISFDTERFIEKYPESSLLVLCYVKGFSYSSEVGDFLKRYVKNTEKYVKATAIVGLNHMLSVMLKLAKSATTMKIKSFDNEEDAKDWLSSL